MSIQDDDNIREVDLATLEENEIPIDYTDGDIVFIDNFQDLSILQDLNRKHSTVRPAVTAMLMVLGGRLQLSIGGREVAMHHNQLLIVPSNTSISQVMASPDLSCKILGMTDRIIQKFLGLDIAVWNPLLYNQPLIIEDLSDDNLRTRELFYDLVKVKMQDKTNPYSTQIMQALLQSATYEVLGSLVRNKKALAAKTDKEGNEVSEPTLSQSQQLADRFLSLLSATNVKRHSVSFYPEQLCVSPKYLTAVMKRYTGKTALRWIQQYSLEEIRSMLDNPHFTVKEAAMRCGFSNLSFFGRYVTGHFGCSPTEYRRRQLVKRNLAS